MSATVDLPRGQYRSQTLEGSETFDVIDPREDRETIELQFPDPPLNASYGVLFSLSIGLTAKVVEGCEVAVQRDLVQRTLSTGSSYRSRPVQIAVGTLDDWRKREIA